MIDVLFITRLLSPENTETSDAYNDLRLTLDGKLATIDYLRSLASSSSSPTTGESANDLTFPVLTPVYMKEYLEKSGISMVEIPILETNLEETFSYLREGVRVVAICTTWLTATNNALQIRKAAKTLKSVSPGTPVIIGGMSTLKGLHIRELFEENGLAGVLPRWVEENRITRRLSATVMKKVLARHFPLIDGKADRDIDAIVLNDTGETTLKAIVEALREGKNFRDIPNLAIPEGRDYRFTETVDMDVDLDSQVIDWTNYVPGLQGNYAPVRRGTGCPYKCAFCDFHGLQKLRMRSMESMIAELKTLTGTGHRKVYFVDDNIAFTKKQLIEFTRAIIAGKMDLSWRSFLRADTIDSETASLLAESGCKEILLGIESGDPQVLKNMNKGTDPDKLLKAIHALDEVGISTQNTFVIGFPGENQQSLDNTAAFISSLPSGDSARTYHRYYMFKFIVSPLSPVAYPESRAEYSLTGIVGRWSHSTMSSKEAESAIREAFLKVKGPSHMYTETLPGDWNDSSIRKVIELRDVVQKERLRNPSADNLETLLATVRSVEGDR